LTYIYYRRIYDSSTAVIPPTVSLWYQTYSASTESHSNSRYKLVLCWKWCWTVSL